MENNVDHPKHYNQFSIEPIDVIEDWKLNFHLGNTIKYIARAGIKDPARLVEDLEKAEWYLHRYIGNLKSCKVDTNIKSNKEADNGKSN